MGLEVALVDLIQKLAALAAGRVDAPLRVDGNKLHNAPFAAFQHLGKGCLLGAEAELTGKVDADARKQGAALRLQSAGDLPALAAAELHGAKRLFGSREERFRAQKVFLLFHAPMIAHRAAAVKGKRGRATQKEPQLRAPSNRLTSGR